jgi:hypothetical protein
MDRGKLKEHPGKGPPSMDNLRRRKPDSNTANERKMEQSGHVVELEQDSYGLTRTHQEFYYGRLVIAIEDKGVVQVTGNFWQRLAGAEKLTLDKYEPGYRCRRMSLTVGIEYGEGSIVKGAKSPIWQSEGGVSIEVATVRWECSNRHGQSCF